ncbi:aldehyde dehydrogenase (NADP(+)) [Streptomyces tubercidicus]|uniref:aldehyde dehydrogenase (NADP(+)) n=1 Tax=Streptomyces tubercidicus TaxID=47759 RepID=UPI0034659C87
MTQGIATADLETILDAASSAAPAAAAAQPAERIRWLTAVADALDTAADDLVALAAEETHLPVTPRLRGELRRTTFQLRLFGQVIADGAYLGADIDHADLQWPMGPRPDIRRVQVPLGPVLVFAASNFPFAFSVAGGDTASALAAGCPVVLKAHPGHEQLSARTAHIVRAALLDAGAPEGLFAMISGVEAGVTALKDPRITAAAFTGSVAGGRALFDIAVARPTPIPFYGELGSINPVVVTPGAVADRGSDIAREYVASFTLGAGQFCTKPGILFLPEGHGLDEQLRQAVSSIPAQPLLNQRIATGYETRLGELRAAAAVDTVVAGARTDQLSFTPTLLAIPAKDFLVADPGLRQECFGPASLVVTYHDQAELHRALALLDPGLTATVHGEQEETGVVRALLAILNRQAGRLVWNEWPTGVTVSWAQHHGGPYPATTAPTTTSVGAAAIARFQRPVAWQGFPDALLPEALREGNPWGLPRRVDGERNS